MRVGLCVRSREDKIDHGVYTLVGVNSKMGRLVRIAGLTLGTLTLFGFAYVLFLLSDLNPTYDNQEVGQLQSEIKNAEGLPKEFVDVVNELKPITSTTGVLTDWMKTSYVRRCPCLEVASINHNLYQGDNRFLGNRYILSLKLEKKVSQEECLGFLVRHYDFLYGNTDISKAAKFYFNKDFENLEKDEFATLALMLENSSLYNPKRRPELIAKRLDKLNY